MPRHNGSGGLAHTCRQKGYGRRGNGVGTYSRRKKSRNAELYDRPYLSGKYTRDLLAGPSREDAKGHRRKGR